MAEHTSNGRVEVGAEMDFPHHQQTYNLFLVLIKHASLYTIALLIAMAFGFFTSAGFFSSLILFILICGVGHWLLR